MDGEVTEIGLTTVKVQNWDKTITTVPTHKLVSESFTNWRGMEESGGRRIKRSVNIDVSSIHYLSDAELATLGSSQLLRRYMEKKLAELAEYNANRASDLDERRLTNIGTFREYMEQWIESNPDINQDMTHMVRQLQPGPCLCRNALVQPAGIPIFGRSGRTGTVTALKQKGAALWKNSTAPFFIPAAPAQPTVAFRRYRLRASAACSS